MKNALLFLAILLCVFFHMAVAMFAYAQSSPSGELIITNVLIQDSSLSIYGNNFGIKKNLIPYAWDDFDDGADMTQWSSTHLMTESSNLADQRKGSTGLIKKNIKSMEFAYVSNTEKEDESETWYASYWMKLDPTFTTGNQSYLCPSAGECNAGSPNTNVKLWRMWDNGSNNTNWYTWFFISGSNCARNSVTAGFSLELSPTISSKSQFDYTVLGNGDWHYLEFALKHASGVDVADGILEIWVDGMLIHSDLNVLTNRGDRPNLHLSSLGWRAVSCQQTTDCFFYMDDAYVAASLSRIEIGDRDNFNNCTLHELQPILRSWTNDVIEFEPKIKALNDGSYFLFVINEEGNVSNGYPINIVNGAIYLDVAREFKSPENLKASEIKEN